jgi:hypothetical protein
MLAQVEIFTKDGFIIFLKNKWRQPLSPSGTLRERGSQKSKVTHLKVRDFNW